MVRMIIVPRAPRVETPKPIERNERHPKRHGVISQNGSWVRAYCPTCEAEGCHDCRFTGIVERHASEYEKLVFESTLI